MFRRAVTAIPRTALNNSLSSSSSSSSSCISRVGRHPNVHSRTTPASCSGSSNALTSSSPSSSSSSCFSSSNNKSLPTHRVTKGSVSPLTSHPAPHHPSSPFNLLRPHTSSSIARPAFFSSAAVGMGAGGVLGGVSGSGVGRGVFGGFFASSACASSFSSLLFGGGVMNKTRAATMSSWTQMAGFSSSAASSASTSAAAVGDNDDLYAILEVPRDADAATIKKSYYKLAKKYHPDANKGNEDAAARFAAINNAYEVLSDKKKRAHYDMHGTTSGAGFGGGQGGPGGGFQFNPEDLFNDLFGGGGGGGRGVRRGSDVEVRLRLTFMEAVRGVTKDVTYLTKVPCNTCNGSGAAPGSSPVTCNNCNGTGQETVSQAFFFAQTTCRRCGGEGTIVSTPCRTCGGSKTVSKSQTVPIDIPAGVETGVNIRHAGAGEAGPGEGSIPGDLYVHLEVEDDPVFHRDGADLHVEVPISVSQAILGDTVVVPTVKSDVEIKVPPGTQPDEKRVLRGRGIKRLQAPGHGNQYVHFRVMIPKKITDNQKAAIEAFAKDEAPMPSPQEAKSGAGGFLSKLKNMFK